MKVAIIGAGIAGLATAIGLERVGIDYTLHERTWHLGREGLGFILQKNGLDALAQLSGDVKREVEQAGAWLERFTLRDPQGRTMLEEPLPESLGLRRADLLASMMRHIQPDRMMMRQQFVEFERDANGRAIAALFENGHRQEADLFLACDGSRSQIRQSLFPQAQLEPVRVLELVSILHNAELVQELAGRFLKTQRAEGGLSFGLVPCGGDHVIWYMQFDANRYPLPYTANAQERALFAQQLVGHWPDPIPQLLSGSDWRNTHLWRTTDMNALPSLHHENVVLLGDAGHPMLTFSSQGVNLALDDAQHLCAMLRQGIPSSADLSAWSRARLAEIAPLRETGRELSHNFLVFDPTRDHAIPLAS